MKNTDNPPRPANRDQLLRALELVMGELPGDSRRVPLRIRELGKEKLDSFTRRKIAFEVERNDWLPAYLLIPRHRAAQTPAMLCLHQTTRCGKAEPAGLDGQPSLHYAAHLAERGYVTLAPDYGGNPAGEGFGEYHPNPYEMGYASATMKGIWNHMRAIDLLQTLPEVDGERIGSIGHSLGGHNSIFVAAFDQRIKAVVSSCGFTSLARYALTQGGDLAAWSHGGYMPLVATSFGNDPARMPFEFADILASLAPRPFLAVAPLHDGNFDVSGVRECIEEAAKCYTRLGAAENIEAIYPDAGHDFPEEAREYAYAWLDNNL